MFSSLLVLLFIIKLALACVQANPALAVSLPRREARADVPGRAKPRGSSAAVGAAGRAHAHGARACAGDFKNNN